MQTQKLTRLITLVLSLALFNSHMFAQWPQWRGPMRDGFSNETNLLKSWPAEGPKLLWSSDIIGDGYSSAIIQDNVIYVTGQRDSVEVISAPAASSTEPPSMATNSCPCSGVSPIPAA